MDTKRPAWIKVKAPTSKVYQETKELMQTHNLHTVCQEASCPNIGECWSKKHATVMILGAICTRSCAFCDVATGRPEQVDPHEPQRVAHALAKLQLNHVVVTSVDRDDLPDGGAGHFAQVIQAIRDQSPKTTIEVLIPDFLRKEGALEKVVAAKPDVLNHNLETVPRLYASVRPGARYFHSLHLLSRAKEMDPSLFTKSGLMVGLGEEKAEIYQVMDDLRSADVDFITLGQYLRPSPKHHPVMDYITPEDFQSYGAMAWGKGFTMVSSSPLTRSSYHAGDDFAQLRRNREKKLEKAKAHAG